MKTSQIAGATLSLLVIACQNPFIHEAAQDRIDDLVVRFGASECKQATPLQSRHYSGPEGSGGEHLYVADEDCLQQLAAGALDLGFEKIGSGRYKYTSDQGWAELLTIERNADGASGRINWKAL